MHRSKSVVGGIVLLGIACFAPAPSAYAAPTPDKREFVAYVADRYPRSKPLREIAVISRHGKKIPICEDKMDLMAGDQIFVMREAVLIVRLAATRETIAVRKTGRSSGTEAADYTVETPSVPPLVGTAWIWFKGFLLGTDQAEEKREPAASRAIKSGTCYNESGKTNAPIPFRIPIFAADRSLVAAGTRPVFVSWEGGAPPFSVTLSVAETGRVITEARGVRACAAYLPPAELLPGRYRLTVADTNNVKEEEDSLFVATQAPAVPRELREADLPEEARQIYAATWLSVLDKGKWAFEAQQRVAAMDCRSPAVQDWLNRWGGLAPCKPAK